MWKKKSKVQINKMYSNCSDSYRPVIIGFVQCQQSSVQSVLKKMDRNTKLNIHQQSSPLGHRKYMIILSEKRRKRTNSLETVKKATDFKKESKVEIMKCRVTVQTGTDQMSLNSSSA